eukprot:2724352-Rhodomonas_salina.1
MLAQTLLLPKPERVRRAFDRHHDGGMLRESNGTGQSAVASHVDAALDAQEVCLAVGAESEIEGARRVQLGHVDVGVGIDLHGGCSSVLDVWKDHSLRQDRIWRRECVCGGAVGT